MKGEIGRVAEFLGKSLTDEQIQMLVDHLSFEKLSENQAVNMECFRRFPGAMSPQGRFLRKGSVTKINNFHRIYIIFNDAGKTGDWKNHFSPELNQKLDDWIADNLKDSDLKFFNELETENVE